MTVPALTTYSAGIGAFSSDWGNTVVQGGALLADLRGFQGLSNMTVWMVGTTAQGDGGQGMFVWNGSATTADDGGVTAIAVSGVTTGRWMRQIAISSTVIIGGLAATTRSLQYLTGALTRWNLFTDNSPETGANAGSNLELWRYSDAGAAISQVMWFNRATGAVTVTGSLALGTPLPPASGGLGVATLAANGVVIGQGTSAVTVTGPGTVGQVLASNGPGIDPSFQARGVAPAAAIGDIAFSTDGATYTNTQKIVQGASVATTSGTSIALTGIPSWAKRVTLQFNGVSTTGSSLCIVQLGAGALTTSGYIGAINSTFSRSAFSTGFMTGAGENATSIRYGTVNLVNVGSNTWIATIVIADSANSVAGFGGGVIVLGGALTQVAITTVGGTDTFDAGAISLSYE